MFNKTILLTFFTLLLVVTMAQKTGKVQNGLINTEIERSELVKLEEATFRALFNENASASGEEASFYFIILEDSLNNTMADVLEQLKDIKPEVKDFEFYSNLSKEEKSKVVFLSFNISEIVMHKRMASVYCGYYEGNLSSSGNIVELRKRFGRWRVISNEVTWIS